MTFNEPSFSLLGLHQIGFTLLSSSPIPLTSFWSLTVDEDISQGDPLFSSSTVVEFCLQESNGENIKQDWKGRGKWIVFSRREKDRRTWYGCYIVRKTMESSPVLGLLEWGWFQKWEGLGSGGDLSYSCSPSARVSSPGTFVGLPLVLSQLLLLGFLLLIVLFL